MTASMWWDPKQPPDTPAPAAEPGAEPSSRPSGPSDLPGNPESFSAAGLQAVRAALLNPRHQLRSAVALQIGQLNELALMLARLQDLVAAAGEAWSGWVERGLAAQEASNCCIRDLTEAKQGQEDALLTLRQGLIAAQDADTARLEAGLRSLAAAAQDLRSATETVAGSGKRFQAQVQDVLQELERRLPEAANQAGRQLEQPIAQLLSAVQPLIWIGGTLGALVAADLLVRVLK